jgi:biopolymer transport protein ExbB/TolQ
MNENTIDPQKAEASASYIESLIGSFQDGGLFMYPIAAMLVIGTIVIIERLYRILFVYHVDAGSFMQKIQRLILDGNVDDAVRLCNQKKDAALPQVFKAALVNADRPFDEIQDQVEVATLSVIPTLQQRMPYLFTIANVSTLLGLLGTIIGLVATFKSIGALEASQKQQLLSEGISTAMNTTAFGLMVAIPCTLFYGFLFNRINHMMDEIEHYSARLLMMIRTGSQFYDRFSADSDVSTEQTPEYKDQESEDNAA